MLCTVLRCFDKFNLFFGGGAMCIPSQPSGRVGGAGIEGGKAGELVEGRGGAVGTEVEVVEDSEEPSAPT